MGKGAKNIHPTDAFRKEERARELKKNKKIKAQERALQEMLSNPQKIEDEIKKLQKESDENRLDKTLKDKIKEMKNMLIVANRKQKSKEATSRPLPLVRVETKEEVGDDSLTIVADTPKDSASNSTLASSTKPLPETSIYYHPLYNPSGDPPTGHMPQYRSAPLSTVLPIDPCAPTTATAPLAPPGAPGLPPPPGSAGVLMGGQNGIPLPPPRPGFPMPPRPQSQAYVPQHMQGMLHMGPGPFIQGGPFPKGGMPMNMPPHMQTYAPRPGMPPNIQLPPSGMPMPLQIPMGGQNGIPLPPPRPGDCLVSHIRFTFLKETYFTLIYSK